MGIAAQIPGPANSWPYENWWIWGIIRPKPLPCPASVALRFGVYLDGFDPNRLARPFARCLHVTEIIPLSNLAAGGPSPSRLESIQGGVITIGNFDGVHLGHQTLLSRVRQLADKNGGPAVAVVLDPHPAAILRPTKVPARLTWIERRAELMRPLGIDALVVCETTPAFLQLTASEFFKSLVIDRLGASAMVEGPNFFFGRDRGGDTGVLTELCRASDVDFQIVDPTSAAGEMISSTRIRSFLELGKVDEAGQLLGGPHRLRGKVVRGASRGREIGFPTANLSEFDVVVPAPGVYGGHAIVDGATIQAAIHVGPNPTFDNDQSVKVEVHLLDYDGDLYDQQLQVDFVTRVRDIARFESAECLIRQLGQDIQSIRTSLASTRDSRN